MGGELARPAGICQQGMQQGPRQLVARSGSWTRSLALLTHLEQNHAKNQRAYMASKVLAPCAPCRDTGRPTSTKTKNLCYGVVRVRGHQMEKCRLKAKKQKSKKSAQCRRKDQHQQEPRCTTSDHTTAPTPGGSLSSCGRLTPTRRIQHVLLERAPSSASNLY